MKIVSMPFSSRNFVTNVAVMHPAINQEEDEVRGLAALEHCQHELDEGVAVDGPGMHVVTLEPAIYRDAGHYSHS